MSNNIKLIRLLSGEELLAEVNGGAGLLTSSDYTAPISDTGPLKVKNPVLVISQPSEKDGNVRIGFVPWILFKADGQEITLRESAIVAIMEPDAKLLEQYRRATSRLQLPDQNIVIPTR